LDRKLYRNGRQRFVGSPSQWRFVRRSDGRRNPELRKDPTLCGQVILRLTIEPDGSVSFCVLQSSDMNAPALTQQVVERVIGFDFGAKEDIVAVTIIYPIDFLPAA
jgi:hypothetical protein